MRIALGSDHAAYEAKAHIKQYLESSGNEVIDVGTHSIESCDYPDYAEKVSLAVQSGTVNRGVLICGTGLGMSMAANRYTGIRAALCHTEELASLSRLHNDSNILCLGARTQSLAMMEKILMIWLDTVWEGDRHARRVQKIDSNPRGQHAE
ncbi:ribose 5-phosphate isomerase B [bacterium]|nr:ribose 5-phosphate isomerase B [bacterium]